MLIGDDVGLGKTVEAGLIISELIQRGKVKRVVFLTPANLKQQWKEALDYFFHIKARLLNHLLRGFPCAVSTVKRRVFLRSSCKLSIYSHRETNYCINAC